MFSRYSPDKNHEEIINLCNRVYSLEQTIKRLMVYQGLTEVSLVGKFGSVDKVLRQFEKEGDE